MSRRLHIMPIDEWPARDRALWLAAIEPKGLFDATGPATGWSEHSRRKTAGGYGFWLSWLRRGSCLDPGSSPGDRAGRDRVLAYVADLRVQRAPYTVMCRVQELHDALRVLEPERDWAWLVEIYKTLRATARPLRDKLARLKPIDELAGLGERLMEEADERSDWSARRRAVLFRDGLMIALLAYRAVRLKNFAAMRLGAHLAEVSGRWWILFSADQTKTGAPYEACFPEALAPRLQRYLTHHRRVLLRGESLAAEEADIDALWVSEIATPLEQGALARRIAKQTRTAFGGSVPPHWFRDAAATSIALDNPRHIGDAALIRATRAWKRPPKALQSGAKL